MREETKFDGCSLSLFTADREEIVAELSDAKWVEEQSDEGSTYTLSGKASDGSVDEVRRRLAIGTETFAFDFEAPGQTYQGSGWIGSPIVGHVPGATVLEIQTHDAPEAVSMSDTSSVSLY